MLYVGHRPVLEAVADEVVVLVVDTDTVVEAAVKSARFTPAILVLMRAVVLANPKGLVVLIKH